MSIMLEIASAAFKWVFTPAAHVWTAAVVLLLWVVVRFYRHLGHYLLKIFRCLILVLLEIMVVSCGILVIGKAAISRVQEVVKTLLSFVELNNDVCYFIAVSGAAFILGVLITFALFSCGSYSCGSGAGKQEKKAKVVEVNTQRSAKLLADSLPRINNTATTSKDETLSLGCSRDLISRMDRFEELMRCVLGKLADVPSIDLIAASFQEVNENSGIENGAFVHSKNTSPLAAPISSIPGGNPLLETDEATAADRRVSTPSTDPISSLNFEESATGNKVSTTQDEVLRKNQSETMTDAMLKEYIGINKEDFFKKVAVMARENREAKRKPNELSEEERQLGQQSLRDLDLKWIKDSFRQVKPSHLQQIGVLTPEESTFSRNSIKEIIRQRRHEAWIISMKKKGVTLFICPSCNTTTTEGHRCFATAWNTKVKRGPLVGSKEVLLTQQGRGAIRLQEQMRLDQEHLEKSYKKLHEKKHLITSQEKQAEALKLHLSSSSSPVPHDTNNQTSCNDFTMAGTDDIQDIQNRCYQHDQQDANPNNVPLGAIIVGEEKNGCRCRNTPEYPFRRCSYLETIQ